MTKLITTRAPASGMLMGEHAVLHGYPALVMALNQWMVVELKPRSDRMVKLHSVLGEYEGHLGALNVVPPFQFVLECIVEHESLFTQGFELSIRSEFASTLGLGSSSAVTVATLEALSLYLKQSWDKKELLQRGIRVVRAVQGGRGSGADVAASIYGGLLYYRQDQEPVRIEKKFPLQLVYAGYKTPTAQVIQHVEQARQQQPKIYDAYFKAIGDTVEQAVQALKGGDEIAFYEQVQHNQMLMEKLGVSDARLHEIIAYFLKQPGVQAAKISGSGLGDCVVVMAKERVTVPEFLEQKGVKIVVEQELTSLADSVDAILGSKRHNLPRAKGEAFAPTNIALIKYWGKRNTRLNLPMTDSLSVTLSHLGATTTLEVSMQADSVILNGQSLAPESSFAKRAIRFLDLFRTEAAPFFTLSTHMNIPSSAGLASSACGFAALVLALNDLFGWQLSLSELSRLARLGSGSACRSLFPGFVKWQAGVLEDGSDSMAMPCPWTWPGLCLGVVMVSQQEKPISSRVAMQNTIDTSRLYAAWPLQVKHDMVALEQSILERNFERFGQIVEQNALSMHATMLAAWPPITYALPQTLEVMHTVWKLRQQGLAVFFTQDAGPNIKLLFQEKDLGKIQAVLALQHVVRLFPQSAE